jgi:Ras GTPase-activating-like protein IQGAP2/3
VSKELAKEPTPEPTPEPEETEEERVARELHDCENDVVGLQAAMRGVAVRDRMTRMKNRFKRSERGIVGLQSIVRGKMVRGLFDEHLRDYRASVDWATMVHS